MIRPIRRKVRWRVTPMVILWVSRRVVILMTRIILIRRQIISRFFRRLARLVRRVFLPLRPSLAGPLFRRWRRLPSRLFRVVASLSSVVVNLTLASRLFRASLMVTRRRLPLVKRRLRRLIMRKIAQRSLLFLMMIRGTSSPKFNLMVVLRVLPRIILARLATLLLLARVALLRRLVNPFLVVRWRPLVTLSSLLRLLIILLRKFLFRLSFRLAWSGRPLLRMLSWRWTILLRWRWFRVRGVMRRRSMLSLVTYWIKLPLKIPFLTFTWDRKPFPRVLLAWVKLLLLIRLVVPTILVRVLLLLMVRIPEITGQTNRVAIPLRRRRTFIRLLVWRRKILAMGGRMSLMMRRPLLLRLLAFIFLLHARFRGMTFRRRGTGLIRFKASANLQTPFGWLLARFLLRRRMRLLAWRIFVLNGILSMVPVGRRRIVLFPRPFIVRLLRAMLMLLRRRSRVRLLSGVSTISHRSKRAGTMNRILARGNRTNR